MIKNDTTKIGARQSAFRSKHEKRKPMKKYAFRCKRQRDLSLRKAALKHLPKMLQLRRENKADLHVNV